MKWLKSYYPVILFFLSLFSVACSTTAPFNQAPTISSVPINNTVVEELYTYDVEASDANGDTLTYSLNYAPSDMTIDSTTGLIQWTPTDVGAYDINIQVSDGALFEIQSFTITVSVDNIETLSPPANLSATDGVYADKIKISWDSVIGASHYKVYRSENIAGTKMPISDWQTETIFEDSDMESLVTYYYWVKAAKSSSGDDSSVYSDFDDGYATQFTIVIYPPNNISATDNLINEIQITWDSVIGASHYQVYRASSLLGLKTAISDWQTETTFEDTDLFTGNTYYYWVKAAKSSSGDSASDYSDYDTGYAIGFSIILSPPTGVSASDGTFSDRIRVTWEPVSGATHYQVYISNYNWMITKQSAVSGWQTETTFDVFGTEPGYWYDFWVKAATSSTGENASDLSEKDPGYRSQ